MDAPAWFVPDDPEQLQDTEPEVVDSQAPDWFVPDEPAQLEAQATPPPAAEVAQAPEWFVPDDPAQLEAQPDISAQAPEWFVPDDPAQMQGGGEGLTAGDFGRVLMSGFANITTGVGEILDLVGLDKAGDFTKDVGDTSSEWWVSGLTKAAKDAREAPLLSYDDGFEIGPTPLSTVLLTTAESAPQLLTAVVPGGAAKKGLDAVRFTGRVYQAMRKVGVSQKISRLVSRASSATVAYSGAEGLIAGADGAAGIEREVANTPIEQLKTTPEWRPAFDSTDESSPLEERERQTVKRMADKAGLITFLRTAVSTAGVSILTGAGALGQVAKKTSKGTLREAAEGAAKEFAQEVPQSGLEQLAQNIGAQEFVDPARDAFEGVLDAAAKGGAAGGLLGGAAGVGHGLSTAVVKKRRGAVLDQVKAGIEAREAVYQEFRKDPAVAQLSEEDARAAFEDNLERAQQLAAQEEATRPEGEAAPDLTQTDELQQQQEAPAAESAVGQDTEVDQQTIAEGVQGLQGAMANNEGIDTAIETLVAQVEASTMSEGALAVIIKENPILQVPAISQQLVTAQKAGQTQVEATQDTQRQLSKREQLRHNAFTKPIDELTHEEAVEALKYDQLTGIKSRRSFEELPPGNKFSSIDADGLKWVNDNISPDIGDLMLKRIGEAMKSTDLGDTAFHISGDEFYFTHPDAKVLDKANADMVQYLKDKPITAVLRESGEEVTFTIGVSRGIAETKQEADKRLKENKAERAALGRRSKSREDAPPSLSRTAGGRRGVSDRRGAARSEVAQEDAKTPPKKEPVVKPKPKAKPKTAAKKPTTRKPVKSETPQKSKAGEKSKGSLDDKITKGTPPKEGTILRREDILIPLLKALNQPVLEERIKKGSSTLGDFLPNNHRIRTQKRSDLEVVAHELAHLLDNIMYGGFKGNRKVTRPWMRGNHKLYKTFKKELDSISYDKAMTTEGFAEFLRHWMTNPSVTDAAAPEFSRYWEEFVLSGMDGNPKVAKAIMKAKKEMSAWFSQDLLSRLRSKIGKTTNINIFANNFVDNFRAGFVDSMHGVTRAELRVTGERAPQAGGIAETMMMTRAAYSQADGSVEFGPIVLNKDGSFSFNKDITSLKNLLDEVADDIDNFELYAIARSANELMGQKRENLITEGEIEKGLALGKKNPKLEEAFKKWLAYNKGILDFAESMGLISADQRKGWKRVQYLPFFRTQDGKVKIGSSKTPGASPVTRMLTGGTRNLNNILDNMVQSSTKLIVMSIKNQAMRQTVDQLTDSKGRGKWVNKLPKNSKRVEILNEDIKKKILSGTPDDMKKSVESMLDAAEENLGEGFGQFFIHGQAPLGENMIAIRRDGKLEYYEILDPLLFRSFASMGAQSKGFLQRNLNTIRRLMQGTITTTLDFMGANLARDTLHGTVFSSNGFKPITDSVRGMNSRIKKDQDYQDWIANGGGMASYFIDEGALRKRMGTFLRKKGINPLSIIDAPRKFFWMIEVMGDATESSTRIGEYMRAVANGKNPRVAAYLSREISTDFAKRGDNEYVSFMTDAVMFLNPAIQGLDRVYRGFTKDQNRAQIWAKSATIATISVALMLLNDDNDLYEGLDDFDKDGYWHFFIPATEMMRRTLDTPALNKHGKILAKSKKDGREYLHLRLPKLWEIGAMASIAERTTKHIIDTINKENPDNKELAQTVANIMIDQMKFDLVPAAVNPILEQYMNKNRFTQRKIVDVGKDRLEDWRQFTPHTAEIPRRVGALTKNLDPKYQISPARLQHLIQGYFNGWGYYGLFLTDNLLPGSKKATPRWDQMPVIKRFFEQHPRRTKYERELYELLDASNELESTFQDMLKNNSIPSKKRIKDKLRLMNPVLRDAAERNAQLRKNLNKARLVEDGDRDELRKLEDKIQGYVSEMTADAVGPVKKELRKKDE